MLFKVEHPQLEIDPNRSRIGLRRFKIQKNDESPESSIVNGYRRNRCRSNNFSSNKHLLPRAEMTLQKLKKSIVNRDREIKLLRDLKNYSIKSITPVRKYDAVQLHDMVKAMESRQIQRSAASYFPLMPPQKFTKKNPRVFKSNPITGLVSNSFDTHN